MLAQAPDLDIFSQNLVVRDAAGWQITDAGATYALPRDADGSIVYGTAEGVSWITSDQVVMCSDKAKSEQDHRCRAKDQSIHVFRIPDAAHPLPATGAR